MGKRLPTIALASTTLLWGQSATMIVRPPNIIAVPNAAVTGTTPNKLVKLTGAPSTGIVAAAGDTLGAVGICVSGCGVAAVSATASITQWGVANCVFDAATTAGHYVGISAAVAGNCADAGAAYPVAGQVLGRVLSTNGGGGTYPVVLDGAWSASAERYSWALCMGIDCVVAADAANAVLVVRNATVLACYAKAKTAPTGADLNMVVNRNGAANIFTTDLTIPAGSTAVQTELGISAAGALTAGQYLTIDITQVGAVVPGQSISVACVAN